MDSLILGLRVLISLAAVLGLIALVLVLVRPEVGLYLLAFSVPFQSVREADPTEVKITVTEIVVALAVAAFLARQLAVERGSWRSGPLRPNRARSIALRHQRLGQFLQIEQPPRQGRHVRARDPR